MERIDREIERLKRAVEDLDRELQDPQTRKELGRAIAGIPRQRLEHVAYDRVAGYLVQVIRD